MIDRLLYNICTAKHLLKASLSFNEMRRSPGDKQKYLVEVIAKLGGAATADGEAITWLIANGVISAWNTAGGLPRDVKRSTQIQLVEMLSNFVLTQRVTTAERNKARVWVTDVKGILEKIFERCNPEKDWVIIHGCIECLLNLAYVCQAVQTDVLLLLTQIPAMNIKASKYFSNTTEFQRRIGFRYFEGLAQLVHWGEEPIQHLARAKLSTLTQPSDKIGGAKSVLRAFLAADEATYGMLLCPPAAGHHEWIETVVAATKTLLQEEHRTQARTILLFMQTEFERAGESEMRPDNLAESTWLHLPSDLGARIDTVSAVRCYDLQPGASRRIFIRCLLLAFSCPLKSFEVSEQPGLDMPGPVDEAVEQIEEANVEADDIVQQMSAPTSPCPVDRLDGTVVHEPAAQAPPNAPISPEDLVEVQRTISSIKEYIEEGAAVKSDCNNRRHVVVLGTTGSGKSTLVNSLAGRTLRCLTAEEADLQNMSTEELLCENPITEIGNKPLVSQTRVLRAFNIDSEEKGGAFLSWDAPGFEDSLGPVVNIANAVNLAKLLQSSQSEGLIILALLDAPSLKAGRGNNVVRTFHILAKLFGGVDKKIDKRFLPSIVFCITKAWDAKVLPIKTLRVLVTQAASSSGVEIPEPYRTTNIIVFDPLSRNTEGFGPGALRERLLKMDAVHCQDKDFYPILVDSECVLLEKIAVVLKTEIPKLLQEEKFEKSEEHLRLFNSLEVIKNEHVRHYFREVVESVTRKIQEWSADLQGKKSTFTVAARKLIRESMRKLQQAQVLEEVLGKYNVSVKALYTLCYNDVQQAEKEKQRNEYQELDALFTRTQARLRTALDRASAANPESFTKDFNEHWEVHDCIQDWAGVTEVQLVKGALDTAEKYRQDRMPNQLFVFGDQSEPRLDAFIGKFQKRVLERFQAAQRIAQGTLLSQKFALQLSKFKDEMSNVLDARKDIDFFCERPLTAEQVPSLITYGMDPLAKELHDTLGELHKWHPEMHQGAMDELKAYLIQAHVKAVNILVCDRSASIKQQQDAFRHTVELGMKDWAKKIKENDSQFLHFELLKLQPTHNQLWTALLKHELVETVAEEKRQLKHREETILDALGVHADNYLRKVEEERKAVELTFTGRFEQLDAVSFEVQKQNFTLLSSTPASAANLAPLEACGFAGELLVSLTEALTKMQDLDRGCYDTFVVRLDEFLVQLRERALAECTAAALRSEQTAFQEEVMTHLTERASGIVAGLVDLDSELIAFSKCGELWQALEERKKFPTVEELLKQAREHTTVVLQSLRSEAEQLEKKKALDKGRRDLEYEQAFTVLKTELEAAVRQSASASITTPTQVDELWKLSDQGFSHQTVAELSSLLAMMRTKDEDGYKACARGCEAFLLEFQELRTAMQAAAVLNKELRLFATAVRNALNEEAETLTQQELERKWKQHFPKEAELRWLLANGPKATHHMVQSANENVSASVEHLMQELQQDAQTLVSSKDAERKTFAAEFSKLVAKLQRSSQIIAQNCESLASCEFKVEDVLVLCNHGFDEQDVREVERLLAEIAAKDKDSLPARQAELNEALKGIHRTASEACVARVRQQYNSVLQSAKQTVLANMDDKKAALFVKDNSSLDRLVRISVTDVIAKISSYTAADNVTEVLREVEATTSGVFQELLSEAKRMFQINKALEERQQRDLIANDIHHILTQLPKHQEKDQRDLAAALDKLYTICPHSEDYKNAVRLVQSQIETLQSGAEVQRLLGSKDFVGLSSRYQMLKNFERSLQKHLSIQCTALMFTHVQTTMNELLFKVYGELDCQIRTSEYLQFVHLRYFCSVFDAVVASFSNLSKIKNDLVARAQTSLEKMLGTVLREVKSAVSSEGGQLSGESQQLVAKLLIKGYGVSFELQFVQVFKTYVDRELIQQCNSRALYLVGSSLKQYITEHPSDSDGVREMASIIVDSFPAFKSFNIELFNAKAGSTSFSSALKKMKYTPNESNTANMQQAYDAYVLVYDKMVNEVVGDLKAFEGTVPSIIAQIQTHAQGLRACAMQLSSKPEDFGKLLGQTCALWSFVSCEGSGSSRPRNQVMQPHGTQILGILRMLGLDQTVSGLSNHLIQINTGEGKSIALGITATILALLGFRVDVVCYSQYLADRDYAAFQNLFQLLGVGSTISYQDFDQLSKRIMKEGRDKYPDMRKVFMSFLEGKPCGAVPLERRPSVLLMDEVDVFFSDSFYGNTYNPVAEIAGKGLESYHLIKWVWDNRDKLQGNTEEIVERLLKRPETVALKKQYKNLSDNMLKAEFRKLRQAMSHFPPKRKPRLDDMHPYVVDTASQRIGYTDPVSGVPNFERSYDYITAFTYLYCAENKELELERVQSKLTLQPLCGNLLYSSILAFYSVCLGMTGTLDSMSSVQNDLLDKFNFNIKTFLPSTFQKQHCNKKEQPEHVATVVEVGSWDEYFQRILEDIERQLDRGKATLVVCENQQKLNAFSTALKQRKPNSKGFQRTTELSDQLKKNMRENVVIGAIRRYAVTLVSRSYGRGTDFVCRDDGLVKSGGVHLILTFCPQDRSEEKQIYGRTCRQDNPGSARKILFEDDLQHLAATDTDKVKSGLDWDDYLAQRRSAKENEDHEVMKKNEESNMPKHVATLAAFEAAKVQNWHEAKARFEEIANLNAQVINMAKGHHIVLVLDQSGSMKGERWQSLLEAVDTLIGKRCSALAQDLVSIVAFDNRAEVCCKQVSVQDSPESCLATLKKYGGTSFQAALQVALQVLVDGRGSRPQQYLLFMSDGGASDGADEMQQIAEEFAADELLVNTLAFGKDASTEKLESLAQLGRGTLLTAVDGATLKEEFARVAKRLGHLDR